MNTFFSSFKEKCRTSLWLIPGIFGLLAILLPLSFLYLEGIYIPKYALDWFEIISIESLSITLSTLLAAMVTVFGILLPMTFSILLRTSSQFTPKVLRVYRSALAPKILIGLIFASTLYLMTLLIAMNYLQVPVSPISLLGGFLLILITIFSIPLFFDRLATSLEPVFLINHITKELRKLLKKLEEISSQDEGSNQTSCKQDRSRLDPAKYHDRIVAPKSGYIRSVDSHALVKICEKNRAVGSVPVRPGGFVYAGNPIFYLNREEPLDKEFVSEVQECFAFDSRRVGIADLELQLDELLSIVVKALSPGVTDLSTALECVNHVGVVCNLLLNRQFHNGIHKDKEGKERLFTKEFDFSGFVHAAFDPLRQNAYTQPAVVVCLLKVLQGLVANCKIREQAEVLKEIAHQIVEEVKVHPHRYDIHEIQGELNAIETLSHELKNVSST